MTEIVDTVFRAWATFADSSDDATGPLMDKLPKRTQQNFDERTDILGTAVDKLGGEDALLNSDTPQAHCVKLAVLKLVDNALTELNRRQDINADLALLWPHEPAATSKDVIGFLKKNNFSNFAAIAKGAAAGMPAVTAKRSASKAVRRPGAHKPA